VKAKQMFGKIVQCSLYSF